MKYAVGIDLGGTKIEGALVDEEGNSINRCRVETPSDGDADEIAVCIERAVSEVKDREIEGIGIGTPGFIHENQLASNPNVPGLQEALKMFQSKNSHVIVENDANCFALAEHKWGAGKEADDMVGVIWGTGIGGGIIVDGDLVHGSIGGAGEIGHMILDHVIEEFEEGGPGTWEYLCSGPNIVRRYREAGGEIENARPDDVLSSEEPVAGRVMDDTLKLMGMGLANLVKILNPELIVMGGGVSNLDVYDELNEEMRKYSIDLSGESCEVVKNELGDSAGVLGAAALVLD